MSFTTDATRSADAEVGFQCIRCYNARRVLLEEKINFGHFPKVQRSDDASDKASGLITSILCINRSVASVTKVVLIQKVQKTHFYHKQLLSFEEKCSTHTLFQCASSVSKPSTVSSGYRSIALFVTIQSLQFWV